MRARPVCPAARGALARFTYACAPAVPCRGTRWRLRGGSRAPYAPLAEEPLNAALTDVELIGKLSGGRTATVASDKVGYVRLTQPITDPPHSRSLLGTDAAEPSEAREYPCSVGALPCSPEQTRGQSVSSKLS